MSRITVLLTAVGCPGGATIIRSLRQDENLRIVGTDMRDNIAAKHFCDNFYTVPPGNSEGYVEEILRIVRSEKIDVVLPLATFELEALSKEKSIFEQTGCRVCVSDSEGLTIANNRYQLYKQLANRTYVPQYETPQDLDDLLRKMADLGFPEKKVVLKPFVSHGSIGLRIVDNTVDMYEMYISRKPTTATIRSEMLPYIFEGRKLENILLTEYLPGREIGLDLLVHPTKHTVLSGIVRDNGLVADSAISAGKTINEPELFQIGEEIVAQLSLSYAINIDIKFGDNNQPKVLEINPRLPATSWLATKAGLNMPLWSVYLALDRPYNNPQLREELHIWSYRDFIVTTNDGVMI